MPSLSVTKRLVKNSPLDFQEMDDNWQYFLDHLSSLNTLLSNFSTTADQISQNIISVQNSVSTNSLNISSLQSLVGAIQSSVTSIQSEITALSNDDTSVANHFTALEKTVSDNAATAASNLSAQVSILSNRIDNLSSLLQTAQNTLNLLQTTSSNTTNNVSILQNQMESTIEALAAVQQSLATISTNTDNAITAIASKADKSYVDTQIETREQLNYITGKQVDITNRQDKSFLVYDVASGTYLHKTASELNLGSGSGTLSDTDVTSKKLTNFIVATESSSIATTDSILSSLGKVEYRLAIDDAKISFPGFGTSSDKACTGDDSRLSDARSPLSHASTHKHGGSDEIATATPTVNAIPKSGSNGTIDIGWLPVLSTFSATAGGAAGTSDTIQSALQKHEYRIAINDAKISFPGFGTTADKACVGNDTRLSNARTPISHASTHQNGGSDEIATATPTANAIPKANATGKLDSGWLTSSTGTVDLEFAWAYQDTLSADSWQPGYTIPYDCVLYAIEAYQDSGTSSFTASQFTIKRNVNGAGTTINDLITRSLPTRWNDKSSTQMPFPIYSSQALCIDKNNNMFTWGTDANIREITPAGVVTTYHHLSAIGSINYMCIDSSNNIYCGSFNNGLVALAKITPSGTESIMMLGSYYGILKVLKDSSGNSYFIAGNASDMFVYKMTTAGVISRFATLSYYPRDFCMDSSGNIYVVSSSAAIYKITPAGVVSTFATLATIGYGCCCDSSGNIYVTSSSAAAIYKITSAGVVSTFTTGITSPRFIAIDSSNNLFVTSTTTTLYKVTSAAAIYNFATLGMSTPTGICVDSSNNIYVSNTNTTYALQKITSTGTVSNFITSSSNIGLNMISYDSISNTLMGTYSYLHSNYYSISLSAVITTIPVGISRIAGLAIDSSDILYVIDSTNNTINKISSSGVSTILATLPISIGLAGIAVDNNNNVYVAAYSYVYKITQAGVISTITSAVGASSTIFGLCIDSSGNLYIADYNNNNIYIVTSGGVVSSITNGVVCTGICVDSTGNIFVLSSYGYILAYQGSSKTPIFSFGIGDISLSKGDVIYPVFTTMGSHFKFVLTAHVKQITH